MTNKEKWSATYEVACANSNEIRTYKAKGKFDASLSVVEISDALYEKVSRRLSSERVFDFDIVDSSLEMV